MRDRHLTHISLSNTPPHLSDKIQTIYKELVYTSKTIENEIKIGNNKSSEVLQQALLKLNELNSDLKTVFIEMDRMFTNDQ